MAVFNNILIQLSRNIDDSVKRFEFKDVIHTKAQYQELSGPINWLDRCKLISKYLPIYCESGSPLPVLVEYNIFKLFFFDVGLLSYMFGLLYKDHRYQGCDYKSYVAEILCKKN
ncbi:MAG: hypothetical protein ACI9UT_001039 [Flavobacteriales bacterium]